MHGHFVRNLRIRLFPIASAATVWIRLFNLIAKEGDGVVVVVGGGLQATCTG